jgi:hypothetical protein
VRFQSRFNLSACVVGIDFQEAQRNRSGTVGRAEQREQEVLLAQARVAVAARFRVRLAERRPRVGGEMGHPPDGPVRRRDRFPPPFCLIGRLLPHPLRETALGNEPLAAELKRGDPAILQELIDGVLVQPQFLGHPIWITIVHN